MSNILYPFYSVILKTSASREEVRNILIENTFNHSGSPNQKVNHDQMFYGKISEVEFSLETVQTQSDWINYFEGEIKGVADEIYVYLECKGMKHRRFYFLILLAYLAVMGYVVYDFGSRGKLVLQDTGFLVSMALLVVLSILFLRQLSRFKKKIDQSVQKFSTLIHAEPVKKSEVPDIFRM